MKSGFGRRGSMMVVTVSIAGVACASDDPTGMPQDTNRAPVIGAIALTAEHNVMYDMVVQVRDADGDAVTLSAPTLPSWMTFDAAAGRLSGTPGEAALLASDLVRLEASDGQATTRYQANVSVTLGTSDLLFSGPWVVQAQHRFGHDPDTLVSDHLILYNDFSPMTVRDSLLLELEDIYDTLTARLGVAADDELEWPASGRLHIYADKYQGDVRFGYATTVNGWAFRDGMIVMAPDAPRYAQGGYFPERYRALATHELMHAVEFALNGRASVLHSTTSWFREGIATYMAGLAPGAVDVFGVTKADLAIWRGLNNSWAPFGNPIAINVFADIDPAAPTLSSWYLWFAQGVRYIADPNGFNRGDAGLRAIFDGIRAGMTFEDVFLQETGVPLAQFEAEFFDRMDAFLP